MVQTHQIEAQVLCLAGAVDRMREPGSKLHILRPHAAGILAGVMTSDTYCCSAPTPQVDGQMPQRPHPSPETVSFDAPVSPPPRYPWPLGAQSPASPAPVGSAAPAHAVQPMHPFSVLLGRVLQGKQGQTCMRHTNEMPARLLKTSKNHASG